MIFAEVIHIGRTLASVKRISKLEPIPGRDRIELAVVDGWQVIVKKNEFAPGDLCVYIEIDSVLPERPEFEFLRGKNFRIRTMKMAGTISQGICFPLDILGRPMDVYSEGQDVTAELGVRQYQGTMDDPDQDTIQDEPPKRHYPKWLMRFRWFRNLVTPVKTRGFPAFISKTDEVRIQNAPQYLYDTGRRWVATEKIDGCSLTAALVRHKSKIPFLPDKYEFVVCSRNRRLGRDGSHYWKVVDKYKVEKVLRDLIGNHDWVAIQGEVVGPKIQGNKYKLGDYDLYVFNLLYPYGRKSSIEAKIIVQNHGMKHVPILATRLQLPESVNEVLALAHGSSAISHTGGLREGIVFRSEDGRESFKAVDPEFLLHYQE